MMQLADPIPLDVIPNLIKFAIVGTICTCLAVCIVVATGANRSRTIIGGAVGLLIIWGIVLVVALMES